MEAQLVPPARARARARAAAFAALPPPASTNVTSTAPFFWLRPNNFPGSGECIQGVTERRSALPDARATGRTLCALAPVIAIPLLDEAGADPVPGRHCGHRGDRDGENAAGDRLHRVGERGQVKHH